MKIERKFKKYHIDHGFGFPVKLVHVPMCKVRGIWTPEVDYQLLATVVLRELCEKRGRLTGSELRFIRQYFEMSLQSFSKRFAVTHPAVLRWESSADKPTGMNWSTEKDVRLFTLTKLTKRSNLYPPYSNYCGDA